jgi:release factor glutamine methyltransferase
MEDIATMIDAGAELLSNAGIPEPRREASSLLQHAIGRDRAFLLAHPEHTPDGEHTSRYRGLLARRAQREPFHYITGIKEFFGLEFAVSPAVLIPRPETERLVERGIEILSGVDKPRFCEVGVGSGCISIALLVSLPGASAVGLEISGDALAAASANGRRHRVGDRLELRPSDIFAAVGPGEKFDLIVSNPPYVPAAAIEGLQPEVRDHEPRSALTDGADGLSIIRKIVAESPDFLEPGASLLFEFGFDQARQVRALFSPDLWASVRFEDDLQGIPRIAEATLRK